MLVFPFTPVHLLIKTKTNSPNPFNLKFKLEFKIWPEAWWSLMKREMVWQGKNLKNLKSKSQIKREVFWQGRNSKNLKSLFFVKKQTKLELISEGLIL